VFAAAIRAEFQNSLGWPAGIVRVPLLKLLLLEAAATIDIGTEFVLDGSAALAAVTVTPAGEGTDVGAV
jgi:hypothetical protein